jgi:poly(hydroxyalkanoate) depolymerase family esterase
MMSSIDWRELYASNRAVIERAGGAPGELPAGLRAPLDAAPRAAEGLAGCLNPAQVAGTSGTWDEHTVTVAGQTRRAFVHAPAGLEPQTAVPLVCMLHGCTQDAASFAAATLMNEAADRYGFVAVYPQQERGDNAGGCWNWFLPEHQARGAGEPAAIAAIVRELMGTTSQWAIDTRRVFVAGLSAGGAMAAILAAVYPDLFAAVAVHSGLSYRCAASVGAAFTAMARGGEDPIGQGRAAYCAMGHLARPVPSIVVHGSADHTVAPINADQVLQQSMTANRLAAPEICDLDIARPTTTSRGQVSDGHVYTRSRWTDRHGVLMHELLKVDGLGHAWSGGAPGGSYSDPRGPDATEAIWRFFAQATADRPAG